jgi:hypothetical protein
VDLTKLLAGAGFNEAIKGNLLALNGVVAAFVAKNAAFAQPALRALKTASAAAIETAALAAAEAASTTVSTPVGDVYTLPLLLGAGASLAWACSLPRLGARCLTGRPPLRSVPNGAGSRRKRGKKQR